VLKQSGFLALTFGALILSTPALAVPVVDQENVFTISQNSGFAAGAEQAQTFTVGVTGQLTSIDIFLRAEIIANGPVFSTDPLTVRLLPTIGGAPDNNIANALGEVIVAGGDLPTVHAFHNVDFSAFNIDVTAGDVFAWQIVGNYSAPIRTGDTYAGGTRYCRGTEIACTNPNWLQLSGQDFGFRTYVETDVVEAPEPATLMILGMGLMGLGLAQRRRG
jgi:hypothetical protein